MSDPTPPKSIFKSRTALLALLTTLAGALGTSCEPLGQWLNENTTGLLMLLGAANFWLRRITHERVSIIPHDIPDDIYY